MIYSERQSKSVASSSTAASNIKHSRKFDPANDTESKVWQLFDDGWTYSNIARFKNLGTVGKLRW